MPGAYLDSSAIVKLATEQPGSAALRRYIRRRDPRVSSALARTEVLRALHFEGDAGIARGQAVLERMTLIRVNDRVLNAAGMVLPSDLRSLDAIHLATALQLEEDVSQLVTYDERMASVARALGLRVTTPE